MRRLFVSACVSAWIISTPSAQADSELSIGLKGGPNASTLDENYRVTRYGVSGGIAGQLQSPLGEHFSLGGQLELLYTPRGADTIFEGDYLGTSREHYVDLILAVRPGLRLGRISVYFLAGAGLSYLVSASKESASGVKSDITGDLHRLDVSLLGGAGTAVRLPATEVGPLQLGAAFLEARHDVGLLDTDAVNGGFKNRTSSLMLGLSFVLGSAPKAAPSQTVTARR